MTQGIAPPGSTHLLTNDQGAQLGFKTHPKYLRAFTDKVNAYQSAVSILPEDAQATLSRTGLCAPPTYSETYRYDHESFAANGACWRLERRSKSCGPSGAQDLTPFERLSVLALSTRVSGGGTIRG